MAPTKRKLRIAIVPVCIKDDFVLRLSMSLEYLDSLSFSVKKILKMDKSLVQTKLMILCGGDSSSQYDAVLTIGGIGCGRGDVVPEATNDVIQKPLPALSHFFHQNYDSPTLRPSFGIRGDIIIGNLPGPRDFVSDGDGNNNEDLVVDLAKCVLSRVTRIFDAIHGNSAIQPSPLSLDRGKTRQGVIKEAESEKGRERKSLRTLKRKSGDDDTGSRACSAKKRVLGKKAGEQNPEVDGNSELGSISNLLPSGEPEVGKEKVEKKVEEGRCNSKSLVDSEKRCPIQNLSGNPEEGVSEALFGHNKCRKTVSGPAHEEIETQKLSKITDGNQEPIPFKSEQVSDDDDNTVIFENDCDHGEDAEDDNTICFDNGVGANSDRDIFDDIFAINDEFPNCNGVDNVPLEALAGNDPFVSGDAIVPENIAIKDPSNPVRVDVGRKLFDFFKTHPLTKGVVLNRNKRHIKRDLAAVKSKTGNPSRNGPASSFSVTAENWTRNGRLMKKNWLDDEFELTHLGLELQKRLLEDEVDGENGKSGVPKKDTSVCTWYLSCPGTSTCRRDCGGIGKCVSGCPGKLSKQNRHNCQLMVKMQIFLGDVTKWNVSFHGRHNDSNSLPTTSSSTDRRLFGDEEKRVLNSLISNDRITCRNELFRRLKRHYRQNEIKISVQQKQKLSCFIDRYLIKRTRSIATVCGRSNLT